MVKYVKRFMLLFIVKKGVKYEKNFKIYIKHI